MARLVWEWVGGWVGEGGTGGGDLRPPSPLVCKSHELW